MNASHAIRLGLEMADFVCQAYLADLTDEQLMMRPCEGTNHINWQIGHLIRSEHELISMVAPGQMPALPAGFADRYAKETASLDDPKAFLTKDQLLAVFKEQRAATLAALEKQTDADLDKSTGVDYAPTVGSMFSMQGSHWLMHGGQWVIVRRKVGKPALF